MATLVTFHAHPDDECLRTAGVMRKAVEDGHRVVLVVATKGEVGEVPDGFLADGEKLEDRRVQESHAAAAILGVERVEFLGYRDSGMMGEPTNDDPACFWRADVEKAAEQLAAILREESADVLTVYDDNGDYGHPDHIQVHRVGIRAAELAGTGRVFQATFNREFMQRGFEAAVEQGLMPPEAAPKPPENVEFGKPEAEITAAVDVAEYAPVKRAAMRAHPSQISEEMFMLAMPDDAFAFAFGTEWFIRWGQGPGITETDLMAGL
ncbi:PIG-L family deacetylase [Amycolatopsis sp. cg9]|uniref:PIG-L family deacetylase n=1 Tax=Amycolatopsis sp. cg9 TaxID=3238801 RepID=UPI00352533D3